MLLAKSYMYIRTVPLQHQCAFYLIRSVYTGPVIISNARCNLITISTDSRNHSGNSKRCNNGRSL